MNARSANRPIDILVVEDNHRDVELLERELSEVAPEQFVLENAVDLDEAIEQLNRKAFHLIILDISLPGGIGFDVFTAVKERAQDIPIVVLTSVDDEDLAIMAVARGAQDYIVKSHVNNRHIAHSFRYAVARQQIREQLVNEATVDRLTGLSNRRGFMALAEQQLRQAARGKRSLLLFFVDLDNMKRINDTHGHHRGDEALGRTAAVLRETFRKSDIIGRIGGDEFAVLALEAPARTKEILLNRVEENVASQNARSDCFCPLGLSVGVATYNPKHSCTIHELLKRADRLMYEHKRARKAATE